MQIDCPAQLDDEEAARYINSFWRAKNEPELVLNFSPLKFVYPGGALILALGARDMVRQREQLKLLTRIQGHNQPNSPCSYLSHFGFFQFIGANQGNPINISTGNRNYIPITRIGYDDFLEQGDVIQEQITQHAARLTTVLYPKEADLSKVDMLTFCLREVIRNVFEHSQAHECFVMAQRWNTGIAEITIADEGVGILHTLSQTHKVISARSAIKMALMPGISRIQAPVNDDKWQNSGFGLYVVSEVGKRLGSFSILSNGVMLRKKLDADSWLATPSSGTVVKLRANTNNAEYFPNLLKQIVNEGESLAKQIPGARPTASKGSRLIDRSLW